MPYLSILKALLGLVSWISKYLHDKQLIEAGEYKAIAEANSNALEAIQKAQLARSSVRNDADGLRDDPNNTDND